MAEPLPLCYLNGAYLPLAEARISPLDRGFLYADAVYELMPVYGGRPFRLTAHGERLTPHLARRGVRSPAPPAGPAADVLEGVCACVTAADSRWARCDIKSTALLANVLLRQLSVDAAAAETILLRDGELTEASASAVHVVLGGELLMPPHSRRILPGTTRGVVEELAARTAIHCRVVPISEAQLRAADEVWISAATREVQPVTSLDGHPVGAGKPGPHWRRVHEELQRYKRELAGTPW